VESLEGRAVPASFTAATVPELIGAIDAANQSAEADAITLAPGKTFTLRTASEKRAVLHLPFLLWTGQAPLSP
jgi:hypothetical protein